MTRQTVIPSVLDIRYLYSEEMRPAYGFDLFAVDRFVALDMPPDGITVLETALDPAEIGAALSATGYEADAFDNGALYRMLDDYETALGTDLPRVGMLGALNRIAVLDGGRLVIARATDVVQGALDAQQSAVPSLAESPRYRSAANALATLDEDLGPLVGAIFHDGMVLPDPAAAVGAILDGDDAEAVETAIAAQMAGSVPPYLLAMFGTYRGEDATYLAVGIVLLPGMDATAAADALREGIEGYVSPFTKQPLDEKWAFDHTFTDESGDLPVAGVVMRVDDPPAPAEGERVNPAILSWIDMISRRELGFLVPGERAED